MLIYIAVCGLTIPALGALMGDFYSTDWDDLGDWQNIANTGTIDPAGQLKLTNTWYVDWAGNYHGRVIKQWSDFPSLLTLETKVYWDTRGSNLQLHVYCAVGYYTAFISATEVGLSGTKYQLTTNLNQWYVWRMTVDDASQIQSLYRDGELVGQGTPQTHTDKGFIGLAIAGPNEGDSIAHFDYTYVAQGIHPPEGQEPPPQPEYGAINIYAWDGSQYVGASLTITWPSAQTTTATTPYTNSMAPTGPYVLACAYGKTLTHTFTLIKDQTYTYTFDFSSGEPPPPPPPPPDGGSGDFWETITQILKTPAVTAIFTFGGVGLIGVGLIGLVSGRRRQQPPWTPL